MCGCESWATARASRRKRSSWSESADISRCRSLIATRRSRLTSKARQTGDIPPAPIWASSRYRPLSCMPTRVLIYAPVLWPKQGLPRGRSSRIPKNSVPGAGTPAPSLGIDGAARPGTPFRRLLLDRLLARRGGVRGRLRRELGRGLGRRLLSALLDQCLGLLGAFGLALARLRHGDVLFRRQPARLGGRGVVRRRTTDVGGLGGGGRLLGGLVDRRSLDRVGRGNRRRGVGDRTADVVVGRRRRRRRRRRHVLGLRVPGQQRQHLVALEHDRGDGAGDQPAEQQLAPAPLLRLGRRQMLTSERERRPGDKGVAGLLAQLRHDIAS